IVFGHGMDIVRGHVGIDDGKRLARLQRKDVRMILATHLVDHYRARHWGERILAEIALEIDDDVLERAAITGNDVFSGCRRGMRLGAIGLGGHVDVARLGGRAIELDGPGHGTGSGRIHRFACGVGGGGRGVPLSSLSRTTAQRSSQCYGRGEVPQTFTHGVMTSSYEEFEGPSRAKALTYKVTPPHPSRVLRPARNVGPSSAKDGHPENRLHTQQHG